MTAEERLKSEAGQFLSHFADDPSLSKAVLGVSGYDLSAVKKSISDVAVSRRVDEDLLEMIDSSERLADAYYGALDEKTREHLPLLERRSQEMAKLREDLMKQAEDSAAEALGDLEGLVRSLSVEKVVREKGRLRSLADGSYEAVHSLCGFLGREPKGTVVEYGKKKEAIDGLDTRIDDILNSYHAEEEMTEGRLRWYQKISKTSRLFPSELVLSCRKHDYPEGEQKLKELWEETSRFSASDYARIKEELDREESLAERYAGVLKEKISYATLAEIGPWVKDGLQASQYIGSLKFGSQAKMIISTAGEAQQIHTIATGKLKRVVQAFEDRYALLGRPMTRTGNEERKQALAQWKRRLDPLMPYADCLGVGQVQALYERILSGMEGCARTEERYAGLDSIIVEIRDITEKMDGGVTHTLINAASKAKEAIRGYFSMEGFTKAAETLSKEIDDIYRGIESRIQDSFDTAKSEGGQVDGLISLARMLDQSWPSQNLLHELGEHQTYLAIHKARLEQEMLSLKEGYSAGFGKLSKTMSEQQDRITSVEGRMLDTLMREKESLKRELTGGKPYTLREYLAEGPQPYSYGALRLRNIALEDRPWMERLQSLKDELIALPQFWDRRDVDSTRRLYDGILLEAQQGELRSALQAGDRMERYTCVMTTLEGFLGRT